MLQIFKDILFSKVTLKLSTIKNIQRLVTMKLGFIVFIFLLHDVTSQTCGESESKLAAVTNLVCNDVTMPVANIKRGKKGSKGILFI